MYIFHHFSLIYEGQFMTDILSLNTYIQYICINTISEYILYNTDKGG